jgi:hypothetical protein
VSNRAIGDVIKIRWAAGTLAAGWTYGGGSYWRTPAPVRPDAARMIELAAELARTDGRLSFTEHLVRLWCWGRAPIKGKV